MAEHSDIEQTRKKLWALYVKTGDELHDAIDGNKAAARRARKLLIEQTKLIKELREELLDKVIGRSNPKPKTETKPPAGGHKEPPFRGIDLSDD